MLIKNMEVIKDNLVKMFTIAKLKLDLFLYLEEMYIDTYSIEGYCIPVFNQDDLTESYHNIHFNDDVTIISYECVYQYMIDLYFNIVIGVGTYIKDKSNPSLFTIEKFLVKLKYNEDYSLYDVVFFISRINEAN